MWIEAKRIKRGLYLYLRYREGGRTRSVYLGKAGLGWQHGRSIAITRRPAQPGPTREVVRQLSLDLKGAEMSPEQVADYLTRHGLR